MSDEQKTPLVNTNSAPADGRTRSLHVKRVPWAIWAKARQNALLSEVPFRTFVIELLARSSPQPAEAGVGQASVAQHASHVSNEGDRFRRELESLQERSNAQASLPSQHDQDLQGSIRELLAALSQHLPKLRGSSSGAAA